MPKSKPQLVEVPLMNYIAVRLSLIHIFLFTYGAITLYRCSSQSIQLKIKVTYYSPNPGNIATSGLASSAFARHY